MNQAELDAFEKIPQPPRETMGFLADLTSPLTDYFKEGQGCAAGATAGCMERGCFLRFDFPEKDWNVSTAFMSLRRVLGAKEIAEKKDGYPILFRRAEGFEPEEFEVGCAPAGAVVSAGDSEGLRRAVYFLEDRMRECEGKAVTAGKWRKKPFVKHRISRCFFGPTYRAPFFIDELMNDVDYYPDEYLNKLAHESINGLWLTMYFKDLPSSVFPGRGGDAEKRFEKLRLTVERCARFGIKIYVFFSEPKLFGNSSHCVPEADAATHPELVREFFGSIKTFCTSTKAGMRYLEESVSQLFHAVPQLGGIINIMFGEDNGSCAAQIPHGPDHCKCPECAKKGFRAIFHELAALMTGAMKKESPAAEYIAWIYAPGQRDGSSYSRNLESIADGWPEECGIMYNFESGGVEEQFGLGRNVFDYSLAYVGPSQLFRNVAGKVKKMAAKLQVGCSHEDASVPFIPVPLNLYDKYKTMHEYGVYAAMQCWYFGNYPGLMNKAAGALSFEPFVASGKDFLAEFAKPDWRKFAPTVAEAWTLFSRGYRKFPGNIAFEWFGPLHHSIAWPLHLFPKDAPISPSWILKNFPEISGDRIGECLIYQHTLAEGLELCREMCALWEKGLALLAPLRSEFKDNPPRLADIDLAEAVGLQMRSTRNLLEFYSLREDMLFYKKNHLGRMAEIVRDEISNSERMIVLCEHDSRLGYHSEAEGYLFFPEKLHARIELLRTLLAEDFVKFDLQSQWIGEYTGATPKGASAVCGKDAVSATVQQLSADASWSVWQEAGKLWFRLKGVKGKNGIVEIEPCRLWPPVRVDVSADGSVRLYDFIFREIPEWSRTFENDVLTVALPMEVFEAYRHAGFPMRVNVQIGESAWVERNPFPNRLLHRDFNPACAGWLLFE